MAVERDFRKENSIWPRCCIDGIIEKLQKRIFKKVEKKLIEVKVCFSREEILKGRQC